MNSKKLVSAALTATTVLWMVGAAALPLANAQTSTSSLQTQIASLLAEIQTLQSQLNTSGTPTTTSAMTYDFTSDLTVGSTGAQVMALQQFLIAQGDLVLATPTTYFGSMTQAALAKFQAANGITPSVGYFGPKTMAFINAMSAPSTTTTTSSTLPAGCTSATGFSPTTGVSCTSGATVTTATGAPLSVAMDAQSPIAQNLAAGAVNTTVLKLDFTAGATPVTVTNLVLTRSGLSQDSDLNNVYLYSNGTKLASNLGFNNGAITFSNGAGLFTVPANSTEVVSVNVDIASGAGTGHIFMIGLASSSAITAGGVTFGGNFPLNSAQFTIASVSNLATFTITPPSSSTISVNAGQTDELVGQFTAQAGNNPVKLNAITFTLIGSLDAGDLQNVKLMNGATQLGATISSLGTGNVATFDLSGAPLMLSSGQSVVLSLYADVAGGVSRYFQFSIQQSSDVQAVDTTYGVGIGASVSSIANNGGFPLDFYYVNVNNGGLVISKDLSSPTTYAVAGNTNQVLGVFDVLASGDSIKFNQLNFAIGGTNTSTINNFRVIDDQGAQIGTTVNSSGTVVTEGSGSLNYIIPANTTRVLTVYGDLPTGAAGSVQISLGSANSSAQDYTNYSTVPVSEVGANSLTILTSGTNLVATTNYSLGSPVQAPAGASTVEIGSYTFTAGQVNGVNLTGISVLTASNVSATNLRNLRVVEDGTQTQIGSTQPTVASDTTYNFNSNAPIAIAANGALTLDVLADINSSLNATGTQSGMTTLTGVNASTNSGNSVAISGNVTGQSVNFSTGGTLTGALSAGTSQASFLGMGVTGVNVAQYQFKADTNGNETLTQVNLTDSNSSTAIVAATDHSTFINYRLTDSNGNTLGTATENSSGQLAFNLTGYSIPANSTQYVNLIADVNSYPYASSSAAHAFGLTSFQFTNASTASTTNVASNNIGNLFTVYQNTLGVTGATQSGWSFGNSISGVGNIVGAFSFTAGGQNNNPQVLSVQLSTGGSIVSSTTSQVLGLYDASAPSVLLASTTLTGTGKATFSFTGNNWTLPLGGTRTLLVETLAAPTGLVTFTGGSTGSYQVVLNGATWSDGVSTLISSLSPSISIPVASQNLTGLSN